jgi:hypothetical protein
LVPVNPACMACGLLSFSVFPPAWFLIPER